MYPEFNTSFVNVQHKQRIVYLAQEYRAAEQNTKIVRGIANRVTRMVSEQIASIVSGMNQNGRGTLQPST